MEGHVNSPLNGKTEENKKMASVITCGAQVQNLNIVLPNTTPWNFMDGNKTNIKPI
jgi:hypothetical protein